MDTTYAIDNYVNTKPGEPYRLLPFGTIHKGGETHTITPENAAQFKLPHYKPAIKLGSHEDTTPAAGQIVGLEVRKDGLYAIPELNDKGGAAILDGAYRYHSPEILWGNTAIQDPKTGRMVSGPFIVGDALLHNPHLGEDAALYHVEPTNQGVNQMTVENVNVPKTFLDALLARFSPDPQKPEQKPDPDKFAAQVETYKAEALQAKKERDDLAAQVAAIETDNKRKALVSDLATQLQNKDKFGMTYIELAAATTAAEVLSGMTDEQRAWCMKNFSAMAAQIDASKIGGEVGSDGGGSVGDDAASMLDAAVKAKMIEKKVDYGAAFSLVQVEQPDLFKQYVKK